MHLFGINPNALKNKQYINELILSIQHKINDFLIKLKYFFSSRQSLTSINLVS